MLPWHKTQPSRHVPTILELCAVTDGRNDRCRRFWANASDLGKALTSFIPSEDPLDLSIEPLYTVIQLAKHIEKLLKHRRKKIAKSITLCAEQFRNLTSCACD